LRREYPVDTRHRAGRFATSDAGGNGNEWNFTRKLESARLDVF